MADARPPHARPGLSAEERASRVELAVAGVAECGDKARRIIVEAIEAAVADALAGRENAMRTVWRATLGTAAAITDARACAVADAHRYRGRLTQRGELGVALLRQLGDALFALRDADPAAEDTTMAGLLGLRREDGDG